MIASTALPPAPVGPDVHEEVLEHLKNVTCVGHSLTSIVRTYSAIATTWHNVVAIVLKELNTQSGTRNLTRLLDCAQDCINKQHPPPPFIVGFQHDILYAWTRQIVAAVNKVGGCRWSPPQKETLCNNLKSMTRTGLCHRQHVTVVDAGRNPAWLVEYIRSIIAIWRDGEGEATPVTIQCFKKLASCTPEAMALICAYSQMVLTDEDAGTLEHTLYRIQKIVFSSFGSSGISNTSASQCIRYTCVPPRVFSLLSKVDLLLTTVWDQLTNPKFDDGECCVFPGIVGSHVEEFSLPSLVVKNGSPEVVINCINSALPLSFVNPGTGHVVTIVSSSKSLAELKTGLVCCLKSMLEVERFGGENGCKIGWWDEYLRLTRMVLKKACSDFQIEYTDQAASSTPNTAPMGSSTLFEMRVQRDHYVASKVSKVLAAGNLFDCTYDIAARSARNSSIPVKQFYTILDQKTGQSKDDAALAGRLLVDMNRIVQELGMYGGIEIDLTFKFVRYRSVSEASKMLNVLLDYMKEHSKSRRKRQKDSLFLKHNSRPDHDGRKKPRRPNTPASTVGEAWHGSEFGDNLDWCDGV